MNESSGFFELVVSFLHCTMLVMYSWKQLKYSNILSWKWEQVSALVYLHYHGCF